jgi:hypothetical protein
MNKNQTLSALRPVDWTLAVESAIGINPGCLRSSPTSISETEITAWRTGWIMILETRRLFSPGRFHPMQSLKVRKIHDKTMESAPSRFVRHSQQILLGQLLDVSGIYRTLFSPGPLFLHSRRLIHCSSSHQRSLVEIENIGLRSPNFRVD